MQGFLHNSDGEESAYSAGDPGLIPGLGRSSGEKMATHSSILAWRIPWTRSLLGCNSQGPTESDVAERLSLTYCMMILSFIMFNMFFYLILAVLYLCCCTWAILQLQQAGGYSSGSVWASHCGDFSCFRARALEYEGFSSYGTCAPQLRLLDSRAQSQQSRHTGLVALQSVGSSQVRNQTCVSCIDRWILHY